MNEEQDNELELLEPSVVISASETKSALASKLIRRMREELEYLERLLTQEANEADVERLLVRTRQLEGDLIGPADGSKMIEGVFDGQHMIGSDGNQYAVPPNYASKSKLVEGDILKLTIQSNGTFLFKQIGPIERQRVVGTLMRDEITNDWRVLALGKKYVVLAAAVSYYKGDPGDEAVILIPCEAPSKWAALENVIKV